mmetsp:Transcript_4466/g.8873  ORF Transcript_4466/g.8873 Transcript_4466/m.8873 type:complete len:86 (-) Transcript_4466:814-1071(-)
MSDMPLGGKFFSSGLHMAHPLVKLFFRGRGVRKQGKLKFISLGVHNSEFAIDKNISKFLSSMSIAELNKKKHKAIARGWREIRTY